MKNIFLVFVVSFFFNSIFAQHDSDEPDLEQLLSEKLLQKYNLWDTLFHEKGYIYADSVIIKFARDSLSSTEIDDLTSAILHGHYHEKGINSYSMNLRDSLITMFGYDTEFGKNAALAKIKFLLQDFKLIEAESDIDKYFLLSDQVDSSRVFNLMSLLYRRFGDKNRALEYATKSIEKNKKKNLDFYLSLGALGTMYQEVDSSKHIQYATRAFRYFDSLGHKKLDFMYSKGAVNFARVLIDEGEIEKAESLLDTFLFSIHDNYFQRSQDSALYFLTKSHLEKKNGNIEKVLLHLENALKYDQNIEFNVNTYYSLYLTSIELGNSKERFYLDQFCRSIKDLILTLNTNMLDHELIVFYSRFARMLDRVKADLFNPETAFDEESIEKILELDYLHKSILYDRKAYAYDKTERSNSVLRNRIIQKNKSSKYIEGLLKLSQDRVQQALLENELFVDFFSWKEGNGIISFDKKGIKDITKLVSGNGLRNSIGKELKRLSEDYEKIVLFPDGPTQQIDFFELLNSDSQRPKKYIKTIYKIEIAETQAKPIINRALLLGKSYFSQDSFSNNERGYKYFDLPNVEAEIGNVEKLLENRGYKVFKELNTSVNPYFEDSLIQNMSLVHIASHGFYDNQYDISNGDFFDLNNYFRSINSTGFLLDFDDGIKELSANEFFEFDLKNIELCVLSSCYSGAGYTSNNFGVFGVGRSMLQSGVKNLLMANAKVSDNLTSQFMSSFYERLVVPESDISQAFNESKFELSEKYPITKLGSFVLMQPFIIKPKNALTINSFSPSHVLGIISIVFMIVVVFFFFKKSN